MEGVPAQVLGHLRAELGALGESCFEPETRFMLRPLLTAKRESLLQMPHAGEEPPERFATTVEIEAIAVELEAVGSVERWVGLGSWRTFPVFIHAIAIAIPPERIRLGVAEQIPPAAAGVVSDPDR